MGKIGDINAHQSNMTKVSGITPISQEVVHKICSGQVVLTLAVAVKELLENSLDAGATAVDVRLVDQGSTLIEVADNGSGIKEEDFEGIALKHHTSKLSNFTDLESVSTFGFRGEALSSLCSLCGGLSIVTCHHSSGFASSLEFDVSGSLVKKKPCARQVGTTVTLNSLFSGLPVRRREFLRHLQREFTKMTQLLYAYCLVSTGVRITCTSQKQSKGSHSNVIVATQSGETVRDNIGCVFGHKQLMALVDFKQKGISEEIMEEFGLGNSENLDEYCSEECGGKSGMQRIKDTSSPFVISGCLSSCEHGKGRSAPDRQFFYINSRPCEPTKVARLVNEIYHQYNSHQYPFVFLDIKVNGIDGSGVDVNVTPDKRQIFIEKEKLLLATIKASLLEMYKSTPSTFKLQNLPSSFALRKELKSGSEDETEPSSQSPKSLSSSPLLSKALSCFSQSFGAKTGKGDVPSSFKRTSGAIGNPKNKQPRLDSFVIPKCIVDEGITMKDTPTHNEIKGPESLVLEEPSLNEIRSPEEMKESDSLIINDSENTVNSPKNEEFNCIQSRNSSHTSDSDSAKCVTVADSVNYGGVDIKQIASAGVDDSEKKKIMEVSSFGDSSCGSNVSDLIHSKNAESKKLTEEPGKGGSINNEKVMRSIMGKFSFTAEGRNININESNSKTLKVEVSDFHLHAESSQDHGPVKSGEMDTEVVILDEDVDVDERELKTTEMNVSLLDVSKNFEREEERKLKRLKCEARKKLRFSAAINPKENSMAETELQREITKEMFAKMKIIGQFNLGFLIVKLGSDLFIIDQHASDEKYNFETLQQTTSLQQQPLVVPQPLDLTVAAKSVLTENIEVFERNGFRFSFPPEENSQKDVSDCKAYLTSIPFSRNWTFGKEDVDELIFMLQDSPHANCRPSRVRDMFASRACRKSVMIGDALSTADMQRIVDHMGQMDQPWNCPHGRPTMRHLINLSLITSDLG